MEWNIVLAVAIQIANICFMFATAWNILKDLVIMLIWENRIAFLVLDDRPFYI